MYTCYILYPFRKTVKDITIEEGKKDKVIEQEVTKLFFICNSFSFIFLKEYLYQL